MAYVLQAISGLGALVVFGFLVRNILGRRRSIAASPFPEYARASIGLSYLVTLLVLVPWAAACLVADDPSTWLTVMLSPFALALLVAMPIAKVINRRQSPKAVEYAREKAKRSVGAKISPAFREAIDRDHRAP